MAVPDWWAPYGVFWILHVSMPPDFRLLQWNLQQDVGGSGPGVCYCAYRIPHYALCELLCCLSGRSLSVHVFACFI